MTKNTLARAALAAATVAGVTGLLRDGGASAHSCAVVPVHVVTSTTVGGPCTVHDTDTHSCTTSTVLGGRAVVCVAFPP